MDKRALYVKVTRMEAASTALAVSQVVTLRKSRMVLMAETSIMVVSVIHGVSKTVGAEPPAGPKPNARTARVVHLDRPVRPDVAEEGEGGFPPGAECEEVDLRDGHDGEADDGGHMLDPVCARSYV